MSETTVETKVETAVTPPQKEAPVAASEVDYEAILNQKDAELAQVREEKENYRKGMLKAKGKLPAEEETTPEELDALIDRKVQEKFLTTKEAQLQVEKDNALKAVLKRNKELEVALKNRGQITSNTAAGSNEDHPEVKTDAFFSSEQIQSFKAKGWSDEKIEKAKKNMRSPNQFQKP